MTGNMYYDNKTERKIEIGSFIELDLKSGKEYFAGDCDLARLNSGRSGIYHALRLMSCNTVYLPYYLCPDVSMFLKDRAIKVNYYCISEAFEPELGKNEEKSAVLIVNYFGLFSRQKLILLKSKYRNVIIDNCAAFYMTPIKECYNVYSCRKFFGVPDGCYVVGPGAGSETYYNYLHDQSSDTSAFLLKKIEKGCNAVYPERMKNEERIDNSGVLKMSGLTRSLLCSLDYDFIAAKRRENFKYASSLYRHLNMINPDRFADENTVPLCYPLVVSDRDLVEKLKMHGIYTGRRWSHVLKEVPPDCFEAFLSSFMVPLPVDQRYGKKELDYCYKIFRQVT
jgi:hypothetical protein